MLLSPIAFAIEISLNVNRSTQRAIQEHEREIQSSTDVETHLADEFDLCGERRSRVCSKYELTICYGTAFLWHFNLLILLARRHLPASASRNHGALPLASYYRNCLARTLYSLVCNSNNFQPQTVFISSIHYHFVANEIRGSTRYASTNDFLCF